MRNSRSAELAEHEQKAATIGKDLDWILEQMGAA
jgi:hypothetical protein